MTKYLMSFDEHAMDHIPAAEIPDVAKTWHVVRLAVDRPDEPVILERPGYGGALAVPESGCVAMFAHDVMGLRCFGFSPSGRTLTLGASARSASVCQRPIGRSLAMAYPRDKRPLYAALRAPPDCGGDGSQSDRDRAHEAHRDRKRGAGPRFSRSTGR